MRRTYDRERYLDRVALIREHVPDCALTTDIIVGFPGETEADFERDARGRRGGRLRRRLHVHLLAAPRHRGRRAHRRLHPARGRGRAHGAPRRGRSSAAPASAPSASSAARSTCSSRAPRGTDASRVRGRTTPQQGRQLRRPRVAGRDRPGRRSPPPRARRSPARCRCSPARARPFRPPDMRTYVRALGITSRPRTRPPPAGLHRGCRRPPLRRARGARHPLPRGPDEVRDQPRSDGLARARSSGP